MGGVTDENSLRTHLPALIDVAGKSLAHAPAARETVAELREADDPRRFVAFLEDRRTALGVDQPAADAIVDAARDDERWRETYTRMLQSAEQHLAEQFDSNA